MSVSSMSWVFNNSPYSGEMLVIHLVLSEGDNDYDRCLYLDEEWTAARSHCSVETLRVAIAQMIADGLLLPIYERRPILPLPMYKLIIPEDDPSPYSERERRRSR